MKKTRKKLLAVMMTAALSVCCLAPAATASADDGFKLAVGLAPEGATIYTLMANNITTMVEELGGTVTIESSGSSEDASIEWVENQIAAGVDGMIVSALSDSMLPSVATLCEEAGVYWALTFRSILDPEVKELVESCEYYIGNCYEDEYNTGYLVMQNLNELVGAKKVAIISEAVGNTTTDTREEGAQAACEDFGMEIVAEARQIWQASDATSTAESFMAAYDDLDAIFIVGTYGTGIHEAVAKAIEDAGKTGSVYLASIDFPDAMDELFESGVLAYCAGTPSWGFDPYMITLCLANQCKGTPISDGQLGITVPMTSISDLGSAQQWLTKFGDDSTLYFDTDYISSTLDKANNPDLTVDVLQEIIDQFAEEAAS